MWKTSVRYRPLFVVFLVVGVLLVGNYLTYGILLTLPKVGAVLCPFILYYGLLYRVLWMFLDDGSWEKNKVVLLFITIIVSVYPVCYLLIYKLYPMLGVVLYKEHIVFRWPAFLGKITSSLVTLVLFSFGAVILSYTRSKRQAWKNELEEAKVQLEDMSYRLGLRDINPHFVQAVMITGIGRTLMGAGKQNHTAIIKLTEVMRYVWNLDDVGMPDVMLLREWEQVKNLWDILLWKYGQKKVKLIQEGDPDRQIMVVSMSLLTLMENAIKYTDFQKENALVISLSCSGQGFLFVCQNYYDPQQRMQQKSSRYGLQNLKQRLKRSSLPLDLIIQEGQGYFKAELNNINTHGKQNDIYCSDNR